ncbi:MAG: hypothetical protein K2K64_11540, partial [Muribaculaceae bacterium]|nr:hypothetical protein [Muribaculaceae bacterium]
MGDKIVILVSDNKFNYLIRMNAKQILISILFLCLSSLLSAQTFKLKQTNTVVSFEIKLERMVQTSAGVKLYGSIKQKANFSYN